jgi:hypothetical protein
MRASSLVLCAALALIAAGCDNRMPTTQKVGQSTSPSDDGSAGTFCTMDAKQCPDGSYVGRVPPSCDFAPCP